ncbi:hypothetical protein ABZ817_26600 [Streptomyces antimycoticus]|uniref:hypothetical protein n=1 Tax=Streptomyces antimycoticus TaxID=68175 RepID=UPI0033DB439C
MTGRTSNPHLAVWVAATGLSHGEIARLVAAEANVQGHRQIAPDASRIRRWIDGERPPPTGPRSADRSTLRRDWPAAQ